MLEKDNVTKWVMRLFFKTSESRIGIFSKVWQVQRLSRCWQDEMPCWGLARQVTKDRGPVECWGRGAVSGAMSAVCCCVRRCCCAPAPGSCIWSSSPQQQPAAAPLHGVHGGCSAVPIEPRAHALLSSSVKDRNAVTNRRNTRLQQRQCASKKWTRIRWKILAFCSFWWIP